MADVRSLLRNERNARRVTHPHATYSTTGTLVCLVCNLQLKSESLWNGHLRSPQHVMRLQKVQDESTGRPLRGGVQNGELQDENQQSQQEGSGNKSPATNGRQNGTSTNPSKKRKADSDDEEEEENVAKRSKADLPDDKDDVGESRERDSINPLNGTGAAVKQDIQLPSRPATPLKPATEMVSAPPKLPAVDEDEWAAFEADIAAAEITVEESTIISAPSMSADELAAKSREEESVQRKERLEAEMEGDKEDVARKLDEEFEKMEELDTRMRNLKEKREALRLRGAVDSVPVQPTPVEPDDVEVEDEEDQDDEDDDDGWASFR